MAELKLKMSDSLIAKRKIKEYARIKEGMHAFGRRYEKYITSDDISQESFSKYADYL